MNVGKAIYYKLINDATVNGIVSGRVFQARVAQRTGIYPCVMIQKISDVPYSDDDGNNLFNARMQVNSYHTDHAQAQTLATAVMNAIDFIRQQSINGVDIVEISILNETELVDQYSEQEGVFHIAQDYMAVYQRIAS